MTVGRCEVISHESQNPVIGGQRWAFSSFADFFGVSKTRLTIFRQSGNANNVLVSGSAKTRHEILRHAGRSGASQSPTPRELGSRLDRDPYALLIEFSQTSFFVYRLFKASYGRMPRRDEFLTTLAQLVKGVSIGAEGWQHQLDANRDALLDKWVNSNEFQQTYS